MMRRLPITLLTTLLFTVSANAAPAPQAVFLNKIKKAALCEKSYEITSSLISYSARTQNVFKAAKTTALADDLERKQHLIEKKTDSLVYEAVRFGMSENVFRSTVTRFRVQAEIVTAAAYQQVNESDYQIIARQVDQDCIALTK